MSDSKYLKRGVSADKADVHKAIKNLDKGIYPNAFCKILPDIVANDTNFVNVMHADTAGTKTALAYLYWKETGDVNIWKGIVQDAIVMNIDDMACVGIVDDIMLSSTIGRNKHLITGEAISIIINEAKNFANKLAEFGVNLHLTGGETADVGDIVRTIDVGFTTFARLKKQDIINIDIKPKQVIVGLASYGKSAYENQYNSGIGSNGLTSARHDVLSKHYAKNYKEAYDPNTDEEVVFCGSKKLTDKYQNHTVGNLLLSPTRTYLPFMKLLFDKVDKSKIGGIIHCTGGAQTKVLHFAKNVKIIKDNLLPIPPVFQLIKEESKTDYKEMFKVFNMGHRLELYVDESIAHHIIEISNSLNIDAQIIGKVEESYNTELEINVDGEVLRY